MFIEIDANSKLGPDIITGDPHQISDNGKILSQIIEDHNLFLVNGSELCKD